MVFDCCPPHEERATSMYFMWVVHYLPRLLVIALSRQEYDKIRFPERKEAWQQTLFELAIADLKMDASAFVGLEQRGGRRVDPPPDLIFIAWIRGVYLTDTSLDSPILYVSRRLATKRRVDCEEEILSRLGLKPTYLETLDPREQARLFHSASLVIGPHGGGMTNLLFSKPGTTVLEIDLEAGRRCPLTERMCDALCLRYIPYVAATDYVGEFPQSISQTLEGGEPADFPGDYVVDPNDFVSVVQGLL
jgi:capsular polysaccharide biosynthesis protein